MIDQLSRAIDYRLLWHKKIRNILIPTLTMTMQTTKIMEMVSKKIILRKHFYRNHVMGGNFHLDLSIIYLLIFFYSRRHLRRLAMNALAFVSEKGRPTIF